MRKLYLTQKKGKFNMYDPKSLKAEEFINDGEIQDTLAYADANKNNLELIDSILEKAKERKGLSHREASVLLACENEDKVKEMGDNSGYHLIVLAKNYNGYKNLIKLVSNAWTDGYYYRPRTDRADLERRQPALAQQRARGARGVGLEHTFFGAPGAVECLVLESAHASIQ